MNRKRNLRIVTIIEFAIAVILFVISSFINDLDQKDLVRGIACGLGLGICIQLIIFRLKPGAYAGRKQAEDYNG
jgi:predicted naringenin-chalcone synthase